MNDRGKEHPAKLTEPAVAPEALNADRARLSALLDNLPIGVAFISAEGKVTTMNPAFGPYMPNGAIASISDSAAEHFVGYDDNGRRLTRPQYPVARALRGETVNSQLFLYTAPGREPVWLSVGAVPFRDAAGNVTGCVTFVTDIDAETRARQAQSDADERFRELAENISQFAWTTDASGWIYWYNHRWYEYTGTTLEQMQGWGWKAVHHPDHADEVAARFKAAIDAGEPWEDTFPLRGKDGQYRWFLSRANPIRDADGNILRWFGTNTDITDQIEAQHALRVSDEALRNLNLSLATEVAERTRERDRIWSVSNDLIAVVGLDGYLKAVNPAWSTILGYDSATLLSRHFSELIHPDDFAAMVEMIARLQRGEMVTGFEDRVRTKGGSYRWISWTAVPEGDVFYGFGRDVTGEKEASQALRLAEETLRQSQKMEAVGQLTGGLAHDFNNILTGVIGSLDLIQTRLAQGRHKDVARYVNAAIQSANRAAALTHRLLAFARRQPLDPKPVNVDHLLGAMEDLLRRSIGERTRLVFTLAADAWPTYCDPNQLENSVLNLCINARDAMPDGGEIVIETSNVTIGDLQTARTREIAPGEYVCIAVADSGTGMTPDVIARAFDPFFTTKPLGQGTGLGLSMVYGFAKQSEGHARIESQEGKGTTITLFLPRYTGAMAEETAPVTARPETEGEIVLVVEDDPIVRELVLDILSDLGYRALQAADGPAGLKILESNARIDLLVSDIGLPGMNGRQMAETGRIKRPDLKVLFITGYAENAAGSGGFLQPGMELVTKPFSIDALASRIRDMIAG